MRLAIERMPTGYPSKLILLSADTSLNGKIDDAIKANTSAEAWTTSNRRDDAGEFAQGGLVAEFELKANSRSEDLSADELMPRWFVICQLRAPCRGSITNWGNTREAAISPNRTDYLTGTSASLLCRWRIMSHAASPSGTSSA